MCWDLLQLCESDKSVNYVLILRTYDVAAVAGVSPGAAHGVRMIGAALLGM
jgi:hypothetical protein